MFRGKPVTSEIKNEIVKYLCKKLKPGNFGQCDILWKNLSRELQETQKISIIASQLYNYFLDELVFDVQRKKIDIAQEDIYTLCYPLIMHLCHFKPRFEECEDIKTIRKEKITINKLIIKYFLTENEFSPNLWNEFSKYFNLTKAKYFFINLNDPQYELSLHEKEILRKHILRKEIRNQDDDAQKQATYNWLSKNQNLEKENCQPNEDSQSPDETILDENQLRNIQSVNVDNQLSATTKNSISDTNSDYVMEVIELTSTINSSIGSSSSNDCLIEPNTRKSGAPHKSKRTVGRNRKSVVDSSSSDQSDNSVIFCPKRNYVQPIVETNGNKTYQSLDDSLSGTQSDVTVIFDPKKHQSAQKSNSFLVQETLGNNNVQPIDNTNAAVNGQTLNDSGSSEKFTAENFHHRSKGVARLEVIQLSSDEEGNTIPYSFYDNLSSDENSHVDAL